jgi:hypothetical protein
LIHENAANRYPRAIWLDYIGNALRWLIRAADQAGEQATLPLQGRQSRSVKREASKRDWAGCLPSTAQATHVANMQAILGMQIPVLDQVPANHPGAVVGRPALPGSRFRTGRPELLRPRTELGVLRGNTLYGYGYGYGYGTPGESSAACRGQLPAPWPRRVWTCRGSVAPARPGVLLPPAA